MFSYSLNSSFWLNSSFGTEFFEASGKVGVNGLSVLSIVNDDHAL